MNKHVLSSCRERLQLQSVFSLFANCEEIEEEIVNISNS